MWILNWIPEFLVHFVLIIGVLLLALSYFIKLIPFFEPYKIPLQLVGIILTVLGVWLEGGIAKDKEYKAEIDAAHERAKIAEKKAAIVNTQIKYVYIDKVKTVKDVQVVLQDRIRDVSIKVDEKCKVSKELIEIHNQAARNQK